VSVRRQRLRAWIERFVPASLASLPEEELGRVRVAIGLAWLCCAVFLVIAVSRIAIGNPRSGAIHLVLGTVVAAGTFLLRATGRYLLVVNACLALVLGGGLALAVLSRGAGITSASLVLVLLPLLATLLTGVRLGALWAAATAVTAAGIGVLGHLGLIRDRLPERINLLNEHSALVVTIATVFLVSLLYERGRLRSLARVAALEAERRASALRELRAELESELGRAERLASAGLLAGSVAHEINNPLAYVMSNVALAREELERQGKLTGDLRASIEDSLEGMARIRDIVADLKSLTRDPDEPTSGGVDVARAVGVAVRMAAGHTRARASVVTDLAPGLLSVGNETRVVQILLNLLVNAAQAIGEGKADRHAIRVRAAAEAERVRIEVEDDGPGIPAEHLDRVREPFFTTKRDGGGVGLGLALCDSTVRRYGGELAIESRPGRTVVRVLLPALRPETRKAPAPEVPDTAAAPDAATPAAGAALSILVVDDEAALARTLGRLLEPHAVTLAFSGREAIELLGAGHRYDVVFCDLMMPECTGMDVHAFAERARRDLCDRIVFMTGGTFTDAARAFREQVRNRFLEKPFEAPQLQRTLREVAGAKARQP
jgi:signal transduction histidine kinase/ActR/RegA family two-component response regulator